jgi:Transglutaminase-like superfamily
MPSLVLLEARLELLWVRAALRLFPAATVRAALRPVPARRSSARPQAPLLAAFARACREPWLQTSCLARAVALKRMLARRGRDARLRIGLAPTNPPRGHAWVELAGKVLLDDPAVGERYGFVLRDETLQAFPFVSPARIDFTRSVVS